jgi:hypothetical protein
MQSIEPCKKGKKPSMKPEIDFDWSDRNENTLLYQDRVKMPGCEKLCDPKVQPESFILVSERQASRKIVTNRYVSNEPNICSKRRSGLRG